MQRDEVAPRALIVQHQDDCGPDRFGGWLAAAGLRTSVCRPYLGDPVPERLGGASGLLVLGGSMGAYDDDRHAWLPATRRLLASAAWSGLPTLGICLGAQLLAVACGGQVTPAAPAGIEAGVVDVRWRPEAADDPLCRGLPDPCPSPALHLDGISRLPPGATWLGGTPAYPHQVFRVGAAAWGVQAHPEVSPGTMRAWAPENAAELAAAGRDVASVVAAVEEREPETAAAGAALATRFASLVIAVATAEPGPVRA